MFRQFRKIEYGEQIVIGGDCSQGGADHNVAQFFSKNHLDVPIVYDSRGVAAVMTPEIFKMAELLYDTTGIQPVIGFERQMGGSSEMERLRVLNTKGKYILFVMPTIGNITDDKTKKLGWDTNEASRSVLTGDLKNIIDVHGITVYDEITIQELFWFILNKSGKPEAMRGKHDDHVMSLGVGWQICKRVDLPSSIEIEAPEWASDVPDWVGKVGHA